MSAQAGTAEGVWSGVLDEVERELSFLTEQLIAGVVATATRFVPPVDLPPLPPSLGRPAAFILERMATVEAELQVRAGQIGDRVRGLGREQHERRPMRPAFFDQAV
jgi:hypothetical protein